MKTICAIAEFGSDLHQKSVFLRHEILRKPLGLKFTDIELVNEINQYHLVMILDEEVVGTTLLFPTDEDTIKLRQFAISEHFQGKGLGKKLVNYAEEFALKQGFSDMQLHARETACAFYTKCGYTAIGEQFLEVGIPHYKMIKTL